MRNAKEIVKKNSAESSKNCSDQSAIFLNE